MHSNSRLVSQNAQLEIAVLPDHLHCIWIPPNDANFSKRWRLIKSEFTRHCPNPFRRQASTTRQHKAEQAVWQRWFWELQLWDEADFVRHVDYIHDNPVSHGLVKAQSAVLRLIR